MSCVKRERESEDRLSIGGIIVRLGYCVFRLALELRKVVFTGGVLWAVYATAIVEVTFTFSISTTSTVLSMIQINLCEFEENNNYCSLYIMSRDLFVFKNIPEI